MNICFGNNISTLRISRKVSNEVSGNRKICNDKLEYLGIFDFGKFDFGNYISRKVSNDG